jgi:glycine/serine hydroxymethyltransferase
MCQIADWIAERLNAPSDEALQQRLRAEVTAFTDRFPLYDAAKTAMA